MGKADRQQRLAEQLRANLKKRKQQIRDRKAGETGKQNERSLLQKTLKK